MVGFQNLLRVFYTIAREPSTALRNQPSTNLPIETPDLIVVNPLQAFFGGNLSANEEVSRFVREGLDPIIKDADLGCGLFVVQFVTCHPLQPSSPAPPLRANGRLRVRKRVPF